MAAYSKKKTTETIKINLLQIIRNPVQKGKYSTEIIIRIRKLINNGNINETCDKIKTVIMADKQNIAQDIRLSKKKDWETTKYGI